MTPQEREAIYRRAIREANVATAKIAIVAGGATAKNWESEAGVIRGLVVQLLLSQSWLAAKELML